jgi:hypothetical protein
VYVPYFLLWPVWLYYIFPHPLVNSTVFEGRKKLLRVKYVFWFSLQILSKTFLILRRIQQDIIINLHRSLCEVLTILVRFECNLNFLDRFKKKYSDIKFDENLSSGSWVVPCEHTEK